MVINFIKARVISILKHFLNRNSYCDYLYFPFDISKPLPSSAVDVMKKGCGLLTSLGLDYCLADGTLLGVVRDNNLIPHDTDIDVTVMHPVDTKKIEKEFLKHGFKIGRKVIALNKAQQLVFYSPDKVVFDIIFYTKIGKHVYAFCENDFYLRHDSSNYEKFIPCVFKGYTFYIPFNAEVWLEHVYGVNWKTPKTSKPNDWREGRNEYITAVPYDGNVQALNKKICREENGF